MAEIPSREPSKLIVGDTWRWTKSLADYPAPTWVLTYYMRSRQHEFSIAAAASGSDHSVNVAKATTATRHPGFYQWIAVVDDSTTRETIARGLVTIDPDPLKTGAGFDPRTHARRVLEAIEAVIEKRATKDQQEYVIDGFSLKRSTIEELLVLRDRYVAIVASEDAAANVAAGLGNPYQVGVRFKRV